MGKDDIFEQVFQYRFDHNWALRNILVNYFVYWRGGGNDPRDSSGKDQSDSIRDIHEFIKANGVFKRGQYPGIGRMLMIENIFEEETSIKRENEADYLYPGLIPEQYVQLFESVVNKEYGLDQVLFKKPTPYTVAQFMWNVYHNKDRNGKRGRKPGSAHMLEIAKLLFEDKFSKGLVSEKDSGIHGNFYGRYLLVKADDYCWPLFFLSGSHLIDDPVEVFNVRTAYKVSDPDTEFPTICGTYFGDNIKEYARRNGIQLLQISSLFKFFRWVDRKRGEGITSEKIAPHLDIIPRQPEVPIPVGKAIQEMRL